MIRGVESSAVGLVIYRQSRNMRFDPTREAAGVERLE